MDSCYFVAALGMTYMIVDLTLAAIRSIRRKDRKEGP